MKIMIDISRVTGGDMAEYRVTTDTGFNGVAKGKQAILVAGVVGLSNRQEVAALVAKVVGNVIADLDVEAV